MGRSPSTISWNSVEYIQSVKASTRTPPRAHATLEAELAGTPDSVVFAFKHQSSSARETPLLKDCALPPHGGALSYGTPNMRKARVKCTLL